MFGWDIFSRGDGDVGGVVEVLEGRGGEERGVYFGVDEVG